MLQLSGAPVNVFPNAVWESSMEWISPDFSPGYGDPLQLQGFSPLLLLFWAKALKFLFCRDTALKRSVIRNLQFIITDTPAATRGSEAP
jgi:hypothetical protein